MTAERLAELKARANAIVAQRQAATPAAPVGGVAIAPDRMARLRARADSIAAERRGTANGLRLTADSRMGTEGAGAKERGLRTEDGGLRTGTGNRGSVPRLTAPARLRMGPQAVPAATTAMSNSRGMSLVPGPSSELGTRTNTDEQRLARTQVPPMRDESTELSRMMARMDRRPGTGDRPRAEFAAASTTIQNRPTTPTAARPLTLEYRPVEPKKSTELRPRYLYPQQTLAPNPEPENVARLREAEEARKPKPVSPIAGTLLSVPALVEEPLKNVAGGAWRAYGLHVRTNPFIPKDQREKVAAWSDAMAEYMEDPRTGTYTGPPAAYKEQLMRQADVAGKGWGTVAQVANTAVELEKLFLGLQAVGLAGKAVGVGKAASLARPSPLAVVKGPLQVGAYAAATSPGKVEDRVRSGLRIAAMTGANSIAAAFKVAPAVEKAINLVFNVAVNSPEYVQAISSGDLTQNAGRQTYPMLAFDVLFSLFGPTGGGDPARQLDARAEFVGKDVAWERAAIDHINKTQGDVPIPKAVRLENMRRVRKAKAEVKVKVELKAAPKGTVRVDRAVQEMLDAQAAEKASAGKASLAEVIAAGTKGKVEGGIGRIGRSGRIGQGRTAEIAGAEGEPAGMPPSNEPTKNPTAPAALGRADGLRLTADGRTRTGTDEQGLSGVRTAKVAKVAKGGTAEAKAEVEVKVEGGAEGKAAGKLDGVDVLSMEKPRRTEGRSNGEKWAVDYAVPSATAKSGKQRKTQYFFDKTTATNFARRVQGKPEVKAHVVASSDRPYRGWFWSSKKWPEVGDTNDAGETYSELDAMLDGRTSMSPSKGLVSDLREKDPALYMRVINSESKTNPNVDEVSQKLGYDSESDLFEALRLRQARRQGKDPSTIEESLAEWDSKHPDKGPPAPREPDAGELRAGDLGVGDKIHIYEPGDQVNDLVDDWLTVTENQHGKVTLKDGVEHTYGIDERIGDWHEVAEVIRGERGKAAKGGIESERFYAVNTKSGMVLDQVFDSPEAVAAATSTELKSGLLGTERQVKPEFRDADGKPVVRAVLGREVKQMLENKQTPWSLVKGTVNDIRYRPAGMGEGGEGEMFHTVEGRQVTTTELSKQERIGTEAKVEVKVEAEGGRGTRTGTDVQGQARTGEAGNRGSVPRLSDAQTEREKQRKEDEAKRQPFRDYATTPERVDNVAELDKVVERLHPDSPRGSRNSPVYVYDKVRDKPGTKAWWAKLTEVLQSNYGKKTIVASPGSDMDRALSNPKHYDINSGLTVVASGWDTAPMATDGHFIIADPKAAKQWKADHLADAKRVIASPYHGSSVGGGHQTIQTWEEAKKNQVPDFKRVITPLNKLDPKRLTQVATVVQADYNGKRVPLAVYRMSDGEFIGLSSRLAAMLNEYLPGSEMRPRMKGSKPDALGPVSFVRNGKVVGMAMPIRIEGEYEFLKKGMPKAGGLKGAKAEGMKGGNEPEMKPAGGRTLEAGKGETKGKVEAEVKVERGAEGKGRVQSPESRVQSAELGAKGKSQKLRLGNRPGEFTADRVVTVDGERIAEYSVSKNRLTGTDLSGKARVLDFDGKQWSEAGVPVDLMVGGKVKDVLLMPGQGAEGVGGEAKSQKPKGKSQGEDPEAERVVEESLAEMEKFSERTGLDVLGEGGWAHNPVVSMWESLTGKKFLRQRGIDLEIHNLGDVFRTLKTITGKGAREIWSEAKDSYSIAAATNKAPLKPGEGAKAVEHLQRAIDEATALSPAVKEGYALERGRRISAYDAQEKASLEAGKLTEARKARLRGMYLSGPLFEEGTKPQVTPLYGELRPKDLPVIITPKDYNALHRMIRQHPGFDAWDNLSVGKSLDRLMSGDIPGDKALADLRLVFGDKVVNDLVSKKPFTQRLWREMVSAVNVPRTLMSFMDMSAVLRQAAVSTIAHPFAASKALARSFHFVFSPKDFETYFRDVLPAEEYYPQMKRSGLAITDPTSGDLSQREEAFLARHMEKVPVLGHLVKASERAYVGYLTKLRVDLFKDWVDVLRSGNEINVNAEPGTKDAKAMEAMAEVVNTFTGRGEFAEGLGDWKTPMNAVFFSPRLILSRMQALNPQWYVSLLLKNHTGSPWDRTLKIDPVSRKIATRAMVDMAKFVGVGMTVLWLARQNGAQVELDPHSSDFGKIRVGNTRWDVWAGHQQYVRALFQFATGRVKQASGRTYELGRGYKPRTRYDVFMDFWSGKTSPPVSMAMDWAKGTNSQGQPFKLWPAFRDRMWPLYMQDLKDAWQDAGLGRAATTAVPGFFGVGVQTYKPQPRKLRLL